MKKILLLLSLFVFFFFVFFNSQLSTLNSTVSAQEPRFVANEVIIKYKTGKSPVDFQKIINQKEIEKKTIMGFFRVTLQDFLTRWKGLETPEMSIKRLETVDKNLGVVAKKELYTNPPPELANAYLIKLKNQNVKEAVATYKKLPEIEYAEPNYILSIQ